MYCNNDILEYSIFHKSHQYTDVYTTILVFINTRWKKTKYIHMFVKKKKTLTIEICKIWNSCQHA